MKKLYAIIALVFVLSIMSITSVFAAIDLSLEDLQAKKTAEAYSPVHLQFTIKNTGDEVVITGMQIQPFTPDSYNGLGVYNLFFLAGAEKKPITELTVYKKDGSTRIEKVEERMVSGVELYDSGAEQKFTQPVDSIQLFPGESVKLEHDFQFRDAKAVLPGTHQLGLRFVGYQQPIENGLFVRGEKAESNSKNNEQLTTITVEKRAPLVETENFDLEGFGELKSNQYFMHDYWEYHENKKLCATVESNEICLLEGYDGINYPFTVNGKQLEADWKAKLLYNWDDTFMETWLQKMLISAKVKIDNVSVYIAADTGLLFEVTK
ncbi:hypothetical protein HZA96_01195 [Candidatus Woesearchaeota archaeon]|nr:hypothetical protein [Candidatus Woesearchaeota archaeon]